MKKIHISAEKLYFSADHHFNHSNILKYTKRPYKHIVEMNTGLVDLWNETVPHNAVVVYLGDFAWNGAASFLRKINSKVIFVKGNHDHGLEKETDYPIYEDILEVVPERKGSKLPAIICCHFAMLTWHKMHHGTWHLHGHSHGSLVYPHEARIHDVGVDANNLRPISYKEINEIMRDKRFTVVDHHA